jgi:serine/threonine protein phosphatase 1
MVGFYKTSFLGRMFSPKGSNSPSIPEGIRAYAIGDVHGRLDLLNRLLGAISKDSAGFCGDRILIFLGDYVDRGPDSRGVLDLLLQIKPRDTDLHFLKGNHESALLQFLKDPGFFRLWRRYGAMQCLQSYGVDVPLDEDDAAFEAARDALVAALPEEHVQFLENLEVSFELGDYFFVHAGIRPGIPLHRQSEEDLLWIREEFLTSAMNFGKVIVHGHTPTLEPTVRANRIGLDTGAYTTDRLTCVVLERAERKFLQT